MIASDGQSRSRSAPYAAFFIRHAQCLAKPAFQRHPLAIMNEPTLASPLSALLQSANLRLIAVMGCAAALVALMVGIWFWGQQPEYRVLFANYADRDGGAIVAALQQMNIPYRYAEGGGAILVPAENVHDVRLKLAAQGLPKGGNVGFELMENQKLGISQFLEQVNFQRALEGELARTIQALAGVQAVRVHLALPKASVFLRDQQKPTASVLLNLYQGRTLDPQQVSAIVHLVASSVPELPLANVTVVDQNGTLLSETHKPKSANQLDPSQLHYLQEMQQTIARRITSILTPIVGAANVHAEVSADIDFSTSEQAAEIYRPNQTADAAAIRSQHSSESQSAGNTGAAGVPGALSNQPPAPASAPITAGTATQNAANTTPNSRQKDSTVNYEIDKTLRYTQEPMGGIKRLSVAVVVNHKRDTDKNGKPITRALNDTEKSAITDLVKEAMGYNKERGDTLNVVNSPFTGLEKETIPEPAFWQQPATIQLAKEAGKTLLIASLIGWLYFTQLKPLLRKTRPATATPAVGEPAVIEGLDSVAGTTAGGAAEPAYRNDLDHARQMARDDPKVIANVVKSWVGANE